MKRHPKKKPATAVPATSAIPTPIGVRTYPSMPVRDRLREFLAACERTQKQSLHRYVLPPIPKTRATVSRKEPVDLNAIRELLARYERLEEVMCPKPDPITFRFFAEEAAPGIYSSFEKKYGERAMSHLHPWLAEFHERTLNRLASRHLAFSESVDYENLPLLLESLACEALNILIGECQRLHKLEAADVWEDALAYATDLAHFKLPCQDRNRDGDLCGFRDMIQKLMGPPEKYTKRIKVAWDILFLLNLCAMSVKNSSVKHVSEENEDSPDEGALNLAYVFQLRMQLFMDEWGEPAAKGLSSEVQSVEAANAPRFHEKTGNKGKALAEFRCVRSTFKNDYPAAVEVHRRLANNAELELGPRTKRVPSVRTIVRWAEKDGIWGKEKAFWAGKGWT